jgi:hypothetical protein
MENRLKRTLADGAGPARGNQAMPQAELDDFLNRETLLCDARADFGRMRTLPVTRL